MDFFGSYPALSNPAKKFASRQSEKVKLCLTYECHLPAGSLSSSAVCRRFCHRIWDRFWHRLDTTLRIYAHEWKYNAARRSQVGRQLGELFEDREQLTTPERTPLALPPARGASSSEA